MIRPASGRAPVAWLRARAVLAPVASALLAAGLAYAAQPPPDPQDPDPNSTDGVTDGVTSTTAARYPWEDFQQRLQAAQSVASSGSDVFGDKVSLQNGALSFEVTDVSLPGTGLPVAFTRRYEVMNHRDYGSISDGMLGDWNIVAPSISGTFAPDWISSGTPDNRCSDGASPPLPTSSHLLSEFWHGLTIELPGVGGGELLVTGDSTVTPTDGRNYTWVTNDQIHVYCDQAVTVRNHTGEGFVAVAPDGTEYRFDWMAQYFEPDLESVRAFATSSQPFTFFTQRRRNVLYATEVKDRFGNWVQYTYANARNAPAKLTKITASDGRTITINYTGDRVSSVGDGSRTWAYAYGTSPIEGRATLTQVTLPGTAGKWTIDFSQLTDAEIEANELALNDGFRTCTGLELPGNFDIEPVGTVTHPGGATGTFTVFIQEHGRTNVPVACGNVTSQNRTDDDINLFTISYNAFTLKQKTIWGPGLDTATWNYSYPAPRKSFYFPDSEATLMNPICNDGAACNAPNPVCAPTCAGSIRTVVNGPNDEWTQYTFGNSYRYNEGKLLKVEQGRQVGTGAPEVLQTMDHGFDFSRADQQYPAEFGQSLQVNHDGYASQFHRPLLKTDITRQGETFTSEVLSHASCPPGGTWCFDALAHPTRIERRNTLGRHRTELMSYVHDLDDWVVGLVDKVTCITGNPSGNCATTVMSETEYDSLGRPTTHKSFGKLQYTLAYHADGNVYSYKDPVNPATTLTNWYRGVPKRITYPIGYVSANVNAIGNITSTTDENGFTTNYYYLGDGRISHIVYPTGDIPAWTTTYFDHAQVATTEHGIGANHWRIQRQTGNGIQYTYYDGLMRPVVVEEYDSNIPSTTRRFTRLEHDHAGRAVFQSYPGTTSTLSAGVRTTYDALGRVTRVDQDAESPYGVLSTLTQYLAGFQTRVTNPRNKVTTVTDYLAWDVPSMDLPLAIAHPANVGTGMARDAYGKVLAITRAGGGKSVTRNYAYNPAQELCRQDEPETGITLFSYDLAGNLAWSAGGLPSTKTCTTASTDSTVAPRRVDRTYDARNRLKTLAFPQSNGNQTWTYTPDGLPSQVVTSNNSGTTTTTNAYTYNKRRMLTGESQAENDRHSSWTWAIGYGYNGNGHLATLSYPANLIVDFAPNGLGQATKAISATKNFATSVTYHPDGAIKQFTYGNGFIHTTTPNIRGLPTNIKDAYGATKALDDLLYYDQNGNVFGITDAATSRSQRGNRDMVYDDLDRLTSATSAMWTGTATYSYDALDNLLTASVPVTGRTAARNWAYCYDGANRLDKIRVGTCSGTLVHEVSHDLQGNLASKGGGTAYGFDFGNRLRTAGGETYRYDAYGRRVRTSSSLGDLYSLYGQGGQLLWTRDERDQQRRQFIYLGGRLIAEHRRPIGGNTETVTYQHTDALGSVVVTSSESRARTYLEYEPYGALANRAPDDLPGYTGHVMDSATALTYMQQRYYDPGVGMFLSVDPVTAYSNPVVHFHRYRYANNNPYKFIDPDGREVVVAPGEHQEVINKEIGILRSTPSGEAIYQKLHESSNTHTIMAAGPGEVNSTTAESWECCSDENGVPRGGSGSTIRLELDPEKITKSVFVAMAHEMGHADAMDDGVQSADASKASGGGNTPPSEEPAMEVENNVRREHGMPARGPYHPPEDPKR